MAPQSIIARFESKMDAQTAEIAANAKLQNTNYSLLLWLTGVGVILSVGVLPVTIAAVLNNGQQV